MKSMNLDGILVQPYGINCDANILDTILRKHDHFGKNNNNRKKTNINYLFLKNPLKISNIKAKGFKVKGWEQICRCCCLGIQLCPTFLRPLWNHPGKVTVPCHDFLQRISPTQGSKPCLFISCISGRFFTFATTDMLWKH